MTYIEPSLEFPAAFPRWATSNWDFGDSDTGLTLLPVHKDSQAVIELQVFYLITTYCNFSCDDLRSRWLVFSFHGNSLNYVIMGVLLNGLKMTFNV